MRCLCMGGKYNSFSYLDNHDFNMLSKQSEFGKSESRVSQMTLLEIRETRHNAERRELSEDGLKIKHEVDFSYGHSPIKIEYCTSSI